MAEISNGCVVSLTDGRQATVRFIGTTFFAESEWIGLELNDDSGKNDGSVQGERYFDCKPGHGMFVRPSAIAAVIERPVRATKPAPKPGNPQVRARAQSGLSAGPGLRRPGSISSLNAKRDSIGSSSPTPAPKGAAQRFSLKTPSKSPAKQPSVSSTPHSGRSSVSGNPRPSVAAAKPRPTSTKSSMGPPPPPSTSARPSRTSMSGPGTRTSRQSLQKSLGSAPSGLSKRPAPRSTIPNNASEEELSPPAEDSDPSSDNAAGEVPEIGDFAPNLSKPTPNSARNNVRPTPVQPSSQRQAQNSTNARELDEMKTKLRVMEKKRAEDRDRLRALEQLQGERDKFEGIIQKLQAKYQPQQLEISELRKKLREAEERNEEIEKLQAEHDSLMEIATLDREMAVEKADAWEHDCETLRMRVEELELETEILREENEEFGQDMSPEEKSSHGWLQMEKANERYRDALLRLRDVSQQQEADLKDQIKELQDDLEDYVAIKSQYEATKDKLLSSENNVEDLKQQLDTALGAEDMIEELVEKNQRYQDEINRLTAEISEMEDLNDVNGELEWNHLETEKDLQEEIEHLETLYKDSTQKVARSDLVIEDLNYTLGRFRELVFNLQSDLEDMRLTRQLSDTEADQLSARSRAMEDLNLKLQASAAKAQTKTIDIELERMEAQEAAQHLSIVKLYLPEYFESERNSVLALLRFKRASFKADLMIKTIKDMVSEQASVYPVQEDIYTAHDIIEKLLWIASLCSRFEHYITSCSAESFAEVQGSLFELEPVERTLNFWLESLKKDDLVMKRCGTELQRSIALLSHLAESLLPTSLETFADELCMRSTMTQTYIENAVSSMSHLLSLLQSKLPKTEDGDEETTFLFRNMESFVSQTRSSKVAMGKISRAVSDLRSRSLALSQDACGPFKRAEDSAKDLSNLSRHFGESIVLLFSDESRAEPPSLSDILQNMSNISTMWAGKPGVGSESNDAMSFIFTMLRSLGGTLEELGSISSDLSITSEFEKRPSPWIARSAELKSNKTTSPDAEEEIRRLKNEIHEASTALGARDKTIEEQALKVDFVESRMREASKKAAAVKDLEARIEEMLTKESALKANMENQRKDQQALEAERDEIKAQLDRVKRLSGTAGVTATTGAIVDSAVSLATMQENESLRAEVKSLQAAVRFLREENRRQSILDPYSVQRSAELYSWLDAPLSHKSTASVQRDNIQQTASESRDVLTHLLKLTQESNTCDLKSTQSRTAWRPHKEKLRYQVLQQREDFERWAEWKDEVVGHEREQDRLVAAKRERLARGPGPSHTPRPSVFTSPPGLGHGMMSRAWQILGIEQDGRKSAQTGQHMEPAIEPSF